LSRQRVRDRVAQARAARATDPASVGADNREEATAS
jgi:hypothetical protein